MPGNALLFAAACAAGPGFGFVAANRHPECAERRKPRFASRRRIASDTRQQSQSRFETPHAHAEWQTTHEETRAFTGN
jgi:hypothetical protein